MAEIKAGQYVTDGTSVFILDDVRDGNRVGDIVLRPVLHNGYIKANGATVTASEYPRLLKFAQDNNLLVNSSAWNSDKSKYVYNSGADTLKVPDVQGRVLQGTANTVKSIEAGLPNIQGNVATYVYWSKKPNQGETITQGAFKIINSNAAEATGGTTGSSSGFYNSSINIDASLDDKIYGNSQSVQPPALALIPQIKY